MKFPHIPYFSNSRTIEAGDDCKTLETARYMLHKPLIYTTKMDGSNIQISSQHIAARNGLDARHASFDLLKSMNLPSIVPETYLLFGEWLYAEHSIHYEELESYLNIFSIYNLDTNMFESWSHVEEFCADNGLCTVPIIKQCNFTNSMALFKDVKTEAEIVIESGQEGVVVRWIDEFNIQSFKHATGKFVRPNHVQTDKHWKFKPIIKNGLKQK